ncbi:hypothetical protein Hbl1158_05900 [Halobaculum sp. CBA1158]|uniref:DUF7575 domain-containing protein n=1 Tax=Halobaculum sp. CBA1158 TaxID=2904243 RepID=UPI001F45B4B0|nr:hypothetical protein [Halobaculum sp. CBA1158]UIP00889.1 hypothetical protein Hbl1158_05900 [Halobaculum sp. CBA1158]
MQRRPVVAAALAVVPALGHAYLRRWTRGVAWLALLVGSALTVAGLHDAGVAGAVAPGVVPGSWPDGGVAVALAVVLGMSVADAYVLARRQASPGEVTCPRCGRPVDLSIEFCWFCSVEFDYVEE